MSHLNGQKYLLVLCCSFFQDLLAEMDTHEEIIKLLSKISGHINKSDIEYDIKNDSMMEEIKKIQTNLYKVWLRLLEWECLLEQQQLGHLQVLIDNEILNISL